MAYVTFEDNEKTQEKYVLHLGPADWEQLKGLVDETFAHMRSYVDGLPEEDDE